VDSPSDAVVVGDTPLDVQCAAAAGARAVCVATGSFTEEELRRAGADAVLPDLTEPECFFAAVSAPQNRADDAEPTLGGSPEPGP